MRKDKILLLGVYAAVMVLVAMSLPSMALAQTSLGSTVMVVVDQVPYQAQLTVNKGLLERRMLTAKPSFKTAFKHDFEPTEKARHFRGKINSFPQSDLRLSVIDGHWRGIVLLQERLYQVDHQVPQDQTAPVVIRALPVSLEKENGKHPITCATEEHNLSELSSPLLRPRSITSRSLNMTVLQDASVQSSPVTMNAEVAADCPDPVDGLCLMPQLELVYDISYQALSDAESPLDRATRELNELDLFFERSFGYRFSRVAMTFLNDEQDARFSSYNTVGSLLAALQQSRSQNQLTYQQSQRSIMHFVTGRDFPLENGINNVGIAYVDTFCLGNGYNTGLTDAGETALVSVVMAHEIGHNLGAEHDDPSVNGCSATDYVMASIIGTSAGINQFSSCAIAAIRPEMAQAVNGANAQQCLDFPIDLTISQVSLPASTQLVQGEPFVAEFNIIKQGGYVATSQVRVEVVIEDNASGQFNAAALNGQACLVESSTVTCDATNLDASSTLSLSATFLPEALLSERLSPETATELDEPFTYTLVVSVVGGNVAEPNVSNNTLTVSFTDFASPTPSAEPDTETPDDTNSIQEASNEANPEGAVNPEGSAIGSAANGGQDLMAVDNTGLDNSAQDNGDALLNDEDIDESDTAGASALQPITLFVLLLVLGVINSPLRWMFKSAD